MRPQCVPLHSAPDVASKYFSKVVLCRVHCCYPTEKWLGHEWPCARPNNPDKSVDDIPLFISKLHRTIPMSMEKSGAFSRRAGYSIHPNQSWQVKDSGLILAAFHFIPLSNFMRNLSWTFFDYDFQAGNISTSLSCWSPQLISSAVMEISTRCFAKSRCIMLLCISHNAVSSYTLFSRYFSEA